MNQPLLVLDCHYLCHRAFHSSKELEWQGRPTGVIFGFLKSITFLKDEFQTDRIAFCFEHPHLFRREIYPPYKRKRHTTERTDEEKQSYEALAIQISQLHKRYLPQIGFKNVFCFRGMESDDVMAAIAADAKVDEEVILVTADGDLLQCLRPNVSVYSPQKRELLTKDKFIAAHGIPPWQWVVVKAMAGCTSDEVKGIKGVGELTALRYLKGELKQASKAYQVINSSEGRAIVRRNRRLVQLPGEGCPVPKIQEDQISREQWLKVCGMLGMRSLASRPPVATRRMRS